MTDLTPLDRAIRAARRGHNEAARRLLDDVLAASPDDERAVVWRARATDDPSERAHFLNRALALNPDNRWASDELARLGESPDGVAEAGAPAARSLDAVGGHVERIDHLQCPHCGGQVEIHPERGTKALACVHCGSVLDVTAGQAKLLGRFKRTYQPVKDILPGAEFTWEGERHVVSGWLRYKGWDSEESWTWDEWQLIGDSGAVRYLSYASGEGFLLQTPLRPTPKTSRSGFEWKGGKIRFHEVGPASITGMSGELTWRPKLKETLRVAEGQRKGVHYSAEMTADEVEVVGGPKLPELEVWRALGRTDKVQEIEERQAKWARRRKTSSSLAWLWLLGGLALFAASVFVSGMGDEITQTALTYEVEPVTLPDEQTARALVLYDTVSVGTMPLPQGAFTATITTTPPVDAPNTLDLDLAFVTPGSGDVYLMNVPSTSGERGVEQVRTSEPRTRRRYYTHPEGEHELVLLVGRRWGLDRPWTEPASVPVSISLQRVWTPGPFRFAGGFALFMAFVFFLFSRTGPRE